MIVRCVNNDLRSLRSERIQRVARKWSGEDEIGSISVGDEFIVMAAELWERCAVYVYLDGVAEDDCAYPYPLDLFEVVDSGIPCDWMVEFKKVKNEMVFSRLGFAEWLTDDSFYSRLLDKDADAVDAYRGALAREEARQAE